jgi:D-glycero-D-manno-heptose 1,7-bisphosphate phosphatase
MSTLFIDRDGVINERIPGDYVKSPAAFVPTKGLGGAMRLLAEKFDLIFVVTNQQGIGKGLMGEMELANVHRHMLQIATAEGGRIDKVYHCPHRKEANCPCRKPATGMAWLALQDFPEMDLTNAWMVGDSVSDMEFAERLGMRKVLIRGKMEELDLLEKVELDFAFDSLLDFARFME